MQSAGSRSGARATRRLSAPRSPLRARGVAEHSLPNLKVRCFQISARCRRAYMKKTPCKVLPITLPALQGRCSPLRWLVARPIRVRAHPLARPSTSIAIRTPTAPAPQPFYGGRPGHTSNNARRSAPGCDRRPPLIPPTTVLATPLARFQRRFAAVESGSDAREDTALVPPSLAWLSMTSDRPLCACVTLLTGPLLVSASDGWHPRGARRERESL